MTWLVLLATERHGKALGLVSAMFSRLFDFQSESGCLRVCSCYKLVIILKFELVFLLF